MKQHHFILTLLIGLMLTLVGCSWRAENIERVKANLVAATYEDKLNQISLYFKEDSTYVIVNDTTEDYILEGTYTIVQNSYNPLTRKGYYTIILNNIETLSSYCIKEDDKIILTPLIEYYYDLEKTKKLSFTVHQEYFYL